MATRGSLKDRLVKEALSDLAPLFILFAKSKKGNPTLVFATKSQNDKVKWMPIVVSVDGEWSDTLGGTSSLKHNVNAAMFAGIGNHAEVHFLSDVFKSILSDELDTYDEYPGINETVLRSFTRFLNANFRSQATLIPYRVELGLVSLVGTNRIQIVRVKADGDFHSAMPYCVLGGYREVKEGVSVRHRALGLLKAGYSKGIPTVGAASKLIRSILALDPSAGTYEGGTIEFSKH